MGILYTHISPDLDAGSSVWAARKYMGAAEFEIKLVPAGWDGADMQEGDIAVDIEAGGKGIKGKEHGSAFSAIMQKYAPKNARDAIWWLIEYISIQDSHGSVARYLLPGFDEKTIAIMSGSGFNNVMQSQKRRFAEPLQWVMFVGFVIDSLVEEGESRLRGQQAATHAVWVSPTVAIIENSEEPSTSAHLFGKGAKAVIYADGMNIGAVRRMDCTHLRMDDPRITEVIPEVERDGWFAHDQGFLLAWGTRKSPAETPSSITATVLAAAVAKVF